MNHIEHLWNGWRSDYVSDSGHNRTSESPPNTSVFTELLTSGLSDLETFIVHRSSTCFVVMNAFPYSTGHVLVVPYREVAFLDDLNDDETFDLWTVVRRAVNVLRTEFRPEGVNVGLNLGRAAGGSIAQHLHVHVVPRWTGDSNFMTAIATTRTLPEALDVSADRVRNGWSKLGDTPSVRS